MKMACMADFVFYGGRVSFRPGMQLDHTGGPADWQHDDFVIIWGKGVVYSGGRFEGDSEG